MRRSFSLGFLVLLAVATISSPLANSQSKKQPDFSGTWLLDQKKSNDSGLTTRPDLPIRISHHEPEFRVTRPTEKGGQIVERELVYFTDGRGEENEATAMLTTNPSAPPRDLRKERTKSTTRWSGNKVVTRSILTVTAGGRIVQFEQIDEWKLSNDGKVLTQTTRVIPETGVGVLVMASSKKRVYNRV